MSLTVGRVLRLNAVPNSIGFCSSHGDLLVGIGLHLFHIPWYRCEYTSTASLVSGLKLPFRVSVNEEEGRKEKLNCCSTLLVKENKKKYVFTKMFKACGSNILTKSRGQLFSFGCCSPVLHSSHWITFP